MHFAINWPQTAKPIAAGGLPGRVPGIVLAFLVLAACGGGGDEGQAPPPSAAPPLALRIYHDPYGQADWAQDARLKIQLHDHVGTNESRIRAYDAAGYDAIVLAEYSGAPDKPHALRRRLWPPDAVLPAALLASLTNLKFFIPGAEEIGLSDHFISPFLADYVERWVPSLSPQKQSWQYETGAELVSLVSGHGGLALVAHPWNINFTVDQFPGLAGAEIYSAFSEAMRRRRSPEFTAVDRNEVLLDNWDRALATNQSLIGVAVNDHFGPLPSSPVDPDVADSGKTIVLSKAVTLAAVKEAMRRRAVLAVRDQGVVKDRYPDIRRITVGKSSVSMEVEGSIRWISKGVVVGTGASLSYDALPPGARYLRAEIENAERSVVYTQAFVVRPVGDADGDGDVDAADRAICDQVRAGVEQDPDRVAACG